MRLQHGERHEGLGGAHLELDALTIQFALEDLGDLRVDLGEGGVEVRIGHHSFFRCGMKCIGMDGIGPGARSNSVTVAPRW